MTLCPIALMCGCRKCPLFGVCPLKTLIGDYKKPKKDQEGKEEKQGPENKAT